MQYQCNINTNNLIVNYIPLIIYNISINSGMIYTNIGCLPITASLGCTEVTLIIAIELKVSN